MFSTTTTKKISIFQIPPSPLGRGIQITPDLQNINILSFSNFSDVILIDSHPNNTLPQKRVVFMVRNFLDASPPSVYRIFGVQCLRGTVSSRYRIFEMPCLRGLSHYNYVIYTHVGKYSDNIHIEK
jgi:hypothetical protein